jgi:hypothetical protein
MTSRELITRSLEFMNPARIPRRMTAVSSDSWNLGRELIRIMCIRHLWLGMTFQIPKTEEDSNWLNGEQTREHEQHY